MIAERKSWYDIGLEKIDKLAGSVEVTITGIGENRRINTFYAASEHLDRVYVISEWAEFHVALDDKGNRLSEEMMGKWMLTAEGYPVTRWCKGCYDVYDSEIGDVVVVASEDDNAS